MVKTERIREWALECLDKPKTTQEIIDYIKNRSKHGTTRQVLCNVLSHEKRIIKIGKTKRAGIVSGYYNVSLWAKREGF